MKSFSRKRIAVFSTLAASLILGVLWPRSSQAAPAHLSVVELFTSEGCSSCPPADELLNEVSRRSDVLVLGFHVDYWNHLGWPDPYSRPEWTQRQRWYEERLHDGLYTPEAVVDGRRSLVGSDSDRLKSALQESHSRPEPVAVKVTRQSPGANGVQASFTLSGAWQGQRVVVIGYQNGLVSEVRRGENAGRTMRHEAVVLDLQSVPAEAAGTVQLHSPVGSRVDGVAVLVQDPRSGVILGAARV